MDVIASTAFGLKINSQQDKNNEFVRMSKKAFSTSPLVMLWCKYKDCKLQSIVDTMRM